MNQVPTLPTTSASWRVLRWEPMLGSGERLSVAVIVDAVDGIQSFTLLRPGVLQNLYGDQGEAAHALIKSATRTALALATSSGLAVADPGLEGFFLDEIKTTRAESGKIAARQAAALYSSLAGQVEQASDTDEPASNDGASTRFGKEVERLVAQRRIELTRYFWQSAIPVTGGHPIRFTFLSEHAAIQTSVFRGGQISQGSAASRLRMWELMTVMEQSGRRGALIVRKPDPEKEALGAKAMQNLDRWLNQLFEEGDRHQIRVIPVASPEAAATTLEAFAGTD